MKIEELNKIYFLGIGGIGMSALARYFKSLGKEVSGYDMTSTELTTQLIEEGIQVHFSDNPEMVTDDIDLVVYTPAVPSNLEEYRECLRKGILLKKRAEVLGWITSESFTVGVAGTHGKTTTSSIIAHLLKQSPVDCNAFLGGITKNYESNFISSHNSNNVVVEADEYDRSFLTLHPNIAIITSMDADHLDIYGDKNALVDSFQLYANQVKEGGVLIINKDLNSKISIEGESITYSASTTADYYLDRIEIENGEYLFDVKTKNGVISNIQFGLPGRHNIENALAAIAVADYLGVSHSEIKEALKTFKGIKRRFEYIIKRNDLIYIDDYAHHPAELDATISSVKELYPNNKVTGIFQPHLYSRTRDFAEEFAKSLDLLNEVILLDIYPAREKPMEGVTSEMLLRKIKIKNKSICSKKELVDELHNRKLEVLLTLGAGDIDKLVEPIKKELLN